MPASLPPSYRWLVLAFVSLAMFGNYYSFDALNPVGPLLESQLGFTQAQIGLLDTSYNIAALLVLLAGGVFIDCAGAKRAIILFGAISVVGAAVIASAPSHLVMAAGRFIMGVGAEPLIVAATAILGRWFKGKELGFAMGVNLMIARFGSVAADNSAAVAPGLFHSWQPPLDRRRPRVVHLRDWRRALRGRRAPRRACAADRRLGQHRQARARRRHTVQPRLLVCRRPVRHVLCGRVPVPPVREHHLRGCPWRIAGTRGVPEQRDSTHGHVRHTAVRPARRQDRPPRPAPDGGLVPPVSRLPGADGPAGTAWWSRWGCWAWPFRSCRRSSGPR